MSELRAGAAQVVITPPLGLEMVGFAGRASGCTSIHDDLYARALVLEAGDRRVAIVTLDVLTLDADLVEAVRRAAAVEGSFPSDALLINYSHTHGGPATATLRGMGRCDEDYCKLLVRHVLGCLRWAIARLQPARLGRARAPVQIGINRRQRVPDENRTILGHNPQGPVSPHVDLLKVTTAAGQPLACLFSHACHPVVLGGDNVSITGDWPGHACREIAAGLSEVAADGSRPLALFAQGCCGNINPRERGTHEIARRLGQEVAEAVVNSWDGCATTDQVNLHSELQNINAPLQEVPSVEECRAVLERWQAQRASQEAEGRSGPQLDAVRAGIEWAGDMLRLSQRKSRPRTLPYEALALQINNDVIVALAGEVFVEIARRIEARAPAKTAMVLGYSNGLPGGHPLWKGRGAVGYLPNADSYPEGGYEVDAAIRFYGLQMFAPEAAAAVCDHVEALMGHGA